MTSADGAIVRPAGSERLGEIRALQRSDLPETTALFELTLRSGVRRTDCDTVALLERTLLDSPWADPDLPSLVGTDERGRIIGFLGAEVRRMRFEDRDARAVWSQHFAVDPAARHLGVGALLLRRMLKGPQDVTLTDNASEVVRQMWEMLGARTLSLKGIHWVRLFRPWRVAAHVVAAVCAQPRLRAATWPLAVALDAATAVGTARYLHPEPVQDATVPLTPRALVGALPALAERLTLHPAYDEAFLEWQFAELVRVPRRGRLVARLVHDGSGRTLGWYVYYLRPGWRSEVLQIVADTRQVGRVVDHLFAHADRHGSAALRGRLEPGLVETLSSRQCLLWHRGGAMVHSRDTDLVCAAQSDRSLATRLEGEWWGDAFI